MFILMIVIRYMTQIVVVIIISIFLENIGFIAACVPSEKIFITSCLSGTQGIYIC